MELADLSAFLGVPVLVQLHAPLCMAIVNERVKLPYSDKPDEAQPIPDALMMGEKGDVFSTVQIMKYAVLRAFHGTVNADLIEMNYVAPGKAPGTFVQLATLVTMKDIAYVTRVVRMPPDAPSSLILKP